MNRSQDVNFRKRTGSSRVIFRLPSEAMGMREGAGRGHPVSCPCVSISDPLVASGNGTVPGMKGDTAWQAHLSNHSWFIWNSGEEAPPKT